MSLLVKQTPNRILIVDDERLVAANFRDLFRSIGRQADSVFDGGAAVRAIGEGEFDLVLLDMRMPGFNGLEVLVEILRHRPNLCVIVFTGYGSVTGAVEAVYSGAAAMIEKKFEFDEIVKLVDLYYATHAERLELRRAWEAAVRSELFLDLASAMSHLGKNRGMSIGYALYKIRRAASGRPDAAELNEYLGWADSAHEALMHALDMLNTFAHMPKFEAQPVNLLAVIEEGLLAAVRFSRLAERGDRPEIQLDVPPDLVVRGHPTFVPAAIEFLIQNAVDEFHANPVKPWHIEVGAHPDGDSARVTIADTGPGFPPDILEWSRGLAGPSPVPPPRAGRRHKAGISFGIGLYSAYQVVRSCGGSFSVRNRAPHGAIVEFSLPRVAAEPRP